MYKVTWQEATESGPEPRSTCPGGHAPVLITILSCLWLATHQTALYPTMATAAIPRWADASPARQPAGSRVREAADPVQGGGS